MDDEDYEYLNTFKWCVIEEKYTCYAVRRNPHIRMHRVICNCPQDKVVDHIDGNGLNNCKFNLRIVSRRENSQNLHHKKSNKLAGVDYHKASKMWRSRITINGKSIHIGYFNDNISAHLAYVERCKLEGVDYIGENLV